MNCLELVKTLEQRVEWVKSNPSPAPSALNEVKTALALVKTFIESEFPVLTPIHVHSVYKMVSKGLTRRMVVTKENSKTWVMYETQDSARPGARWMIGKEWCSQDNIWRDVAQSYSLPVGIKLK